MHYNGLFRSLLSALFCVCDPLYWIYRRVGWIKPSPRDHSLAVDELASSEMVIPAAATAAKMEPHKSRMSG